MTTPPDPGNLPKGPVDQPAAQAQPVTEAAGGSFENAFGVEHKGMFGVPGTGDTSGFGGLVREPWTPQEAQRPYGGVFDDLVDAFRAAYSDASSAITATVIDRGELTLHIEKSHIAKVCRTFRDDPSLRFELLSSISGVDYLGTHNRLHAVYHLTSMTYRWRIRLETATSVEDPHIPSVTAVYPTADWQEREAYDMFGIIFDGHPALTRILMPDDWEGFPQRKDYPLGGIPVQYKGATIPPPDERRAYR